MNHRTNNSKKRILPWVFIILAAVAVIVGALTLTLRRSSAQTQVDPAARQAQFQEYITAHFPQEDITFASGAFDTGTAGDCGTVRVYRNERYNEWDAFIPADMQNDLRVYFTQFQGIRFGAEETTYYSGDPIPVWSYNIDMPVTIVEWNGETMSIGSIVFFYGAGTPTLYIHSDTGSVASGKEGQTTGDDASLASSGQAGQDGSVISLEQINQDSSLTLSGSYVLTDRDSSIMQEGTLQLSLFTSDRSIAYEQKPYQLTLSEPAALVPAAPVSTTKTDAAADTADASDASADAQEAASVRWKLLPSFIETGEQVRTKILLDLAQRMAIPNVPATDFVNVYVDGSYVGLYLLESDTEDSALSSGFRGDWDNLSLQEQETDVKLYLLYDFLAVAGQDEYTLTCGHTKQGDYPILLQHSLWLQDEAMNLTSFTEETKAAIRSLNTNENFRKAVAAYYEETFAPLLDAYLQDELPVITYNTVGSGRMSTYHYYQTTITSDTSVWNVREWLVGRRQFFDDYYQNSTAYAALDFAIPGAAGTADTTSSADAGAADTADPADNTSVMDAAGTDAAARTGTIIRYYAREGEPFGTLPTYDNNEGTAYYTDTRQMTEQITGWVFTPDTANTTMQTATALSADTIITPTMDNTILYPITEATGNSTGDPTQIPDAATAQQAAVGENAG